MKRRSFILFFWICCCLFLAGCTDIHYSKSIAELAERYVLKKYGESLPAVESERLTQYIQRWFPHKSQDCRVTFQDGEDTFTVWYNAEKDRFYDDRQADMINEQIRIIILSPLREKLMPCEWEIESCVFGLVDDYKLSLKGCYFHTLYQGDIEAFCRAEKPMPNFGGFNVALFTVDENSTEWESKLRLLSDTVSEYFSLPEFTFYGTRRSLYISAAVYREEEWRDDPQCEFLARMRIDEEGTQIDMPGRSEDGSLFRSNSQNVGEAGSH